MAKVLGAEQPSDDSEDGTTGQELAPDSGDEASDRPWEAAPGEVVDEDPEAQPWPSPDAAADGHPGSATDLHETPWPAQDGEASADNDHDAPDGSEQVRRTDADRWAASFASVAGHEEAGREDRRETAVTQEVQLPAAQPSWSSGAPMPTPPAEPSWRNAGSASDWGQASPVATHSTSHAEPAAQPWTTDVPSGFNWSSDTSAAPVSQESQVNPAPDRRADPWGDVRGAEEPGGDHGFPTQGAHVRAAQALPPNRLPPPPAGYPSPPTAAPRQQDPRQSYGNPAFGGQYGGQQAQPPGSQSRWAADAAAGSSMSQMPQQWPPQPTPGQGWQPASQHTPPAPPQHPSADDLTAGSLVKPTAAVPRVGWRKMVHAVSGGTVNPGLSQAELHRRSLIERATAPVRGCHRIAVVSLKGGIGKTTTTAGLGLTLAEHRGDRVVALDANPDAGTLAERLTGHVDVTVRDLLDNVDSIRSFTDVSSFTSLAARLQVLASEQDPEMSEAFNEAEYRTAADVLARYFNIVLTDSGTGLLHSAMSGTLAIADSLVVVGSPSVDGASRASKTLDWLIAHGRGELVSRAVAVISTVRPASKELDMLRLRDHFLARVRAVVEIPYDRHLVTGGIIDMTQLDEPTEQSFLELSATVADGFRLPPLTRSAPAPAGTSRG